jgi:putative transcriptional regulator
VEEIIFDIPVEAKWEEALKRMGIDPVFLSDSAGHA